MADTTEQDILPPSAPPFDWEQYVERGKWGKISLSYLRVFTMQKFVIDDFVKTWKAIGLPWYYHQMPVTGTMIDYYPIPVWFAIRGKQRMNLFMKCFFTVITGREIQYWAELKRFKTMAKVPWKQTHCRFPRLKWLKVGITANFGALNIPEIGK